jgi:hypothetical protein
MIRKLWGPLRGDLTAEQMTFRNAVFAAFCLGSMLTQWLLYLSGVIQ